MTTKLPLIRNDVRLWDLCDPQLLEVAVTVMSIFLGCVSCDCDVGGAVNIMCNDTSGQCTCRPKVHGLRCKQ